jgi:hypothetical protein
MFYAPVATVFVAANDHTRHNIHISANDEHSPEGYQHYKG